MSVAWFRNPVLDERSEVVDREAVNERRFGITTTRRHPAYVYSINKNAALMHKVREVEIHWYAVVSMDKLGRLKQPAMIAHTVCGCLRPLTPDRSRTCAVPLPGSVLCGRCHGEPATFGKHGRAKAEGLTRAKANVNLGCVVAGYPSALALAQSDDTVARPDGIVEG